MTDGTVDGREARAWLRERLPAFGGPAPDRPPPEHPAQRADEAHHHGDLDGVVAAVARALRALHDLDPSDAPLPSGWAALEQAIELQGVEARAGEAAGEEGDRDDVVALPAPYDRYPLADLRSIWVGGRPPTEDLVVCHGRASLDQFLVTTAPGVDGRVEVAAIRDAGRLRVADRHLDLAVVQQSLLAVYGFDAVVLFYEHYGADPDLVRLDHYVLAGLLLDGPVVPASTR